ncbi:hypothetical protein GH714_009843 [Hevea brasiliensis]|uniref:Uncharacterized protein n=1 Tax=Hevea brasiliensis TaxID=3981 RepID=A0A6A6M7D7_HEVBR|nr:hypothetical protein GH714_009843 [Hevea brasiliensis]
MQEKDGVNRHLTPGEFNQPPETADDFLKSAKIEVSNNVETTVSGFEGKPGVTASGSFLESPTIAKVPGEETSRKQEICQAVDRPYQAEKKMTENEKQTQKDEKFKAAEEMENKENDVIGETKERGEKDETSCQISAATGISLKMDKIKERCLRAGGEEISEKKYLTMSRKTQRLLKKNYCREKTPEGVQEKKEKRCSSSLDEKKGPDVDETIEKKESEKEGIEHDAIGESSPTLAESIDIMVNAGETSSAIIENVYDKLESPSVTLATDRSSMQEDDVLKVGDKVDETSTIETNEESQCAINLNENKKDVTPITYETQEKHNLDIPSVTQTEEMCLQKVDETPVSNVVQENWSEDVKESPQEEGQIEIPEKTAQADSSEGENVRDEMTHEQKLDNLPVNHKEGKQNIDEQLAVTEASAGESRDNIGHTVIAAEDKINDAITASGHSKDEPGNEEIKESLEMASAEIETTASGDCSETIACAKEDTSIKDQEESFDKKEKEEKSMDIDAIRDDGIVELENLQPKEPNEKIEIVEVEIPSTSVNELNATHSLEKRTELIEETGLIEGEVLGGISDVEPHDQVEEEEKSVVTDVIRDDGIPKVENLPPAEASEKIDIAEVDISNKSIDEFNSTHSMEQETLLAEGEDTAGQITEGNSIEDISQESVEECAVMNFQNDEKNTDKSSSTESFQESETAKTVDYIANEAKQNDERPNSTVQCSLVKEEGMQSENLASHEKKNLRALETLKGRQKGNRRKTTKESNIKSLSQQSVAQDPIENFQNDDIGFEKSNTENFEESKAVGTGKSIANETNQNDESLSATVPTLMAKEVESLQKLRQLLSQVAHNTEEEIVENPQDNAKEAEMSKEEDDTKGHIMHESDIESLPKESTEQGTLKNLHNDEINAEVSNQERQEELEPTSIVKDTEKLVPEEVNVIKDQSTEPAIVNADDMIAVVPKKEEVTKETSFEGVEVKLEDERKFESSGPYTQEKGPMSGDTKGTALDSLDSNAPRDDATTLVEKRDHEISREAYEAGEDIKHDIQNEAFIAGIDNQREMIITATSSGKISDDKLMECPKILSKDSEFITSEESKPVMRIRSQLQTRSQD